MAAGERSQMIDRYLRDVQGERLCLAPVGSDLRSRRSRRARTESRAGASPTALPIGSDLRSRRSRTETTVRSRSPPNHREPRPVAAARPREISINHLGGGVVEIEVDLLALEVV